MFSTVNPRNWIGWPDQTTVWLLTYPFQCGKLFCVIKVAEQTRLFLTNPSGQLPPSIIPQQGNSITNVHQLTMNSGRASGTKVWASIIFIIYSPGTLNRANCGPMLYIIVLLVVVENLLSVVHYLLWTSRHSPLGWLPPGLALASLSHGIQYVYTAAQRPELRRLGRKHSIPKTQYAQCALRLRSIYQPIQHPDPGCLFVQLVVVEWLSCWLDWVQLK